MDEKITQYIAPTVVDYGGIAELTAGQKFRTNSDAAQVTGNVLLHTSGACNPYVQSGLCPSK